MREPKAQRRTRPASVVLDSRAELVVRMLRTNETLRRELSELVSQTGFVERFRDRTGGSRNAHGEIDAALKIYAHAVQSSALLVDRLLELPEFEPVKARIEREKRHYMPDGPPMSPITRSLFVCWAQFDMREDDETLGQVLEAMLYELGGAGELANVVSELNRSRLGFFVHETHQGDVFRLRELTTSHSGNFLIQSGYTGQPGDLLLVRGAGPPLPGSQNGAILCTPYVILEPGHRDWNSYLERTLQPPSAITSYESLMKRGVAPAGDRYWLEYVLEAYVNHSDATILLAGLPEIEQRGSVGPRAFGAEPGSS
jgi:hypothetical protein